MFIKKKYIFIILIIVLSSCSFNNLNKQNKLKDVSIIIETPDNQDNVLLKENLKRLINSNKNSKLKYILKAEIFFNS